MCKLRFFLFLFLSSSCIFAESFRVHSLEVVKLESEPSASEFVFISINDAVAVFMPEEMTFVDGIELEAHIPAEISQWRDAIAFSIYDGIKPFPKQSQIDFSGHKIFVTAIPSRLTWIARIPARVNADFKENQYTSKINVIPDFSSGFMFLRFQLAMKGIPDDALNSKIKLSVRPILINKGRLDIILSGHKSAEEVEVFIDGEMLNDYSKPLLLDTGIHKINIQSENYRSEMRSVYVEQAKRAELAIVLKSVAPMLSVAAPANALIYLDENRILMSPEAFEISEGEHKIRFVLGDYEVIRNFSVQKGKTYSAHLNVDLNISED